MVDLKAELDEKFEYLRNPLSIPRAEKSRAMCLEI